MKLFLPGKNILCKNIKNFVKLIKEQIIEITNTTKNTNILLMPIDKRLYLIAIIFFLFKIYKLIKVIVDKINTTKFKEVIYNINV